MYGRLSGTKNDVAKFGVRMPRGAFGERRNISPDTSGLPSNHTVPTYSVRRASPPGRQPHECVDARLRFDLDHGVHRISPSI